MITFRRNLKEKIIVIHRRDNVRGKIIKEWEVSEFVIRDNWPSEIATVRLNCAQDKKSFESSSVILPSTELDFETLLIFAQCASKPFDVNCILELRFKQVVFDSLKLYKEKIRKAPNEEKGELIGILVSFMKSNVVLRDALIELEAHRMIPRVAWVDLLRYQPDYLSYIVEQHINLRFTIDEILTILENDPCLVNVIPGIGTDPAERLFHLYYYLEKADSHHLAIRLKKIYPFLCF
jgi:hypothetical protein